MKLRWGCLILVLLFVISGCSNGQEKLTETAQERKVSDQTAEVGQEKEELAENDNKAVSSSKIRIAYFTLADNYENSSEMDAISQASINLENKELIGSTQYFANAIRAEIGGDLFSVIVKEPYPNDYDKIVDMGSEEQDENARPELSSHVENMEQYQTIFIGFPIWWYTMPQAMFTFLEEYDFSGKTIIPFATHGGYGVGSSVEDIKKLCPDAKVIEDIFEANREDISKQIKMIHGWIEGLEISK